jgi:hypothetical protein
MRSKKKISKNDAVVKILSKGLSPEKIVMTLLYLNRFYQGTIENLRPVARNMTLTEKIESFFINLYRPRFNKVIDELTSDQISLFINQDYSREIVKKVFFYTNSKHRDLTIPEYATKILLDSVVGKSLTASIKRFIKTLTPDQITMILNGKYDLPRALFRSYLTQ